LTIIPYATGKLKNPLATRDTLGTVPTLSPASMVV